MFKALQLFVSAAPRAEMRFRCRMFSGSRPLQRGRRRRGPVAYVAEERSASGLDLESDGLRTDFGQTADVINDGTKEVRKIIADAHITDPSTVEASFPSDITDHFTSKLPEKHAFRPKVDPKQTSVLLFPGQGSQFVGMGADLMKYPGVPKMYNIASEILGYNLQEVCLKGPKEKLNKTMYCQPAIFVTSLAAIEKLSQDNPKVICLHVLCHKTTQSFRVVLWLNCVGSLTDNQPLVPLCYFLVQIL